MRLEGRRAALSIALFLPGLVTVACNLITGEHTRYLEASDAETSPVGTAETGAPRDASAEATTDPPPGDASDEPSIVFVLGHDWKSPNDAGWFVDEAGTQITTESSITHPVLVPRTFPKFDGGDYTATATIHALQSSEFGLIIRFPSDGGEGIVVGSEFVTAPRIFMGPMGAPAWSPLNFGSAADSYDASGDHRFILRIQASGATFKAKMWEAGSQEPEWQVFLNGPPTGSGVGFYTYQTPPVILEDLRISVP